jgi:hypothetical protein
MVNVKHEDEPDIGPDPAMDFGGFDAVEVSPDFRAELCVPFTSEQLEALDRIGHEHGGTAIDAVQLLIERALAAGTRR